MLTSDHRVILQELALYTTFLAGALSPTAVPTFCELLFGCMLSTGGFVTQALLSIDFHCVWSSYHHWISRGKWRWKRLSCRLIRLVCSQAPADEPVTLALDNWVTERFSDNAPACRTHHQPACYFIETWPVFRVMQGLKSRYPQIYPQILRIPAVFSKRLRK